MEINEVENNEFKKSGFLCKIKNELLYSFKLAKIIFNNNKKFEMYFLLFMIAVYIINIITTSIHIFGEKTEIAQIHFKNYYLAFFLIIPILAIAKSLLYKLAYNKYSAYPQSATSRFLSWELLNYIQILLVTVISLIFYFIQYGLVMLISTFSDNIVIIYNFDIVFVAAGFLVMLIYLMLITAIIALIAVFIRKFAIYAVLLLSLILFFIIAFLGLEYDLTIKWFETTFKFLTYETSIWMFILKGFGIWAVLSGVTMFINKITLYHKTAVKRSPFMVAITAGFAVSVVMITPFVGFLREDVRINHNTIPYESYKPMIRRIEIDASKVKKGAEIELELTNITLSDEKESEEDFTKSDVLYLNNNRQVRNLKKFSGEKIVIDYSFPFISVDDNELIEHINPEFTAELQKRKLHLKYNYKKNIKAIFCPFWEFLQKFDNKESPNVRKSALLENNDSYHDGNINIRIR